MSSLNKAQEVKKPEPPQPLTLGQVSGYQSFFSMFNVAHNRVRDVRTEGWPLHHISTLNEIKKKMDEIKVLMDKE